MYHGGAAPSRQPELERRVVALRDTAPGSCYTGAMNSEFRLLVESGPAKGRTFVLSSAGADIGRSDQNDIVLPDGELSRRHCRLEFRGSELWVSDLASANGTLVNGREVQESPLHDFDILSIGSSALRIIGPSSAGVPPSSPPPAAPRPAAPVDLGLGSSAVEAQGEEKGSAPQHRAVLWSVAAVLLLIAAALAMKFIVAAPATDHGATRSKPVKTEPQTLAIRYTKLEADLENIFRYELALNADGSLAVEIDDLRQSRHVRREAERPVSAELLADLTRVIKQSGFLGLDERYEGVGRPDHEADYDLVVAIGRLVRRVRVTNRAEPAEFREVREKIETFVRNELGLWAIEYSAEQLRDMALDNLLVGQRLLRERDIQPGNLHEASVKLRECLNLLETVDPKPDFHAEALRDLEECNGFLDARFTDLNFAADRAIKMRNWPEAADALRELMRLVPDRADDRNLDAERRLLDVEARLRKEKKGK